MQIPSSYQPGYKEALLTDPDLAKTYIQHTLIADADALINGLADIDGKQQGVFIKLSHCRSSVMDHDLGLGCRFPGARSLGIRE